MNILAICAYHGDASASLLVDGQLAAAVEEERLRRIKHWAGLPVLSMKECLRIAGIEAHEVDRFAIGRDPRAHLARKAFFLLSHRPSLGLIRDRATNRQKLGAMPVNIGKALDLPERSVASRLDFVEHHRAHLASAFLVSPFDTAAVCAMDGFGDFVSTSIGIGRGNRLDILGRTYFPHSIGKLYLAITQFLGFPRYGDEYKVMGLAPYGRPEYASEIRELIRLRSNGRFALNLPFFRHWSDGTPMTWNDTEPVIGPVFTDRLVDLLGPQRRPEDPVTQTHKDVAASLQVVFEEAYFHVLEDLYARTTEKRLAIAGGCAMNGVANGKIRARTSFREVFIQPASADNGTSLGAAFHVWNENLGNPRSFVMRHAYWGAEFPPSSCAAAIDARKPDLGVHGTTLDRVDDDTERARWTAERIAASKVVGWYQGRMEWGARALGSRSILADPRRADMRDILNSKIKLRETFRPFAPSILEEAVGDWFVDAVPDPFMIQVYPVRPEKRALIPAVTHVDGSGRLQTVSKETNPSYWRLIKEFEKRTEVPIVLNTSFNENEPIVHRPEEALDAFLRTRMDALVLGPYVLEKGA